MSPAPAPDRLLVTPALRAALFAHAREGRRGDVGWAAGGPVEVCGVLGGSLDDAPDGERTARAETCRRVPNVADDPRARYELDPGATVAAIDAVESAGGTHLGFYHSHPEGPRGPSRTDAARATWPGFVYLIVSLGDEPTVGAWRWTGGGFVQLPVGMASEST